MDEELLSGKVVSVDARGVWVVAGEERLFCRVRGRFYEDLAYQKRPIAPGDDVRVSRSSAGEGAVEEIGPRRTRLSRVSADGESEQVIAANVDRLAIVVASRNPPPRPGLIDRLAVAAGNHGIDPFVVVNKVDLGAGPSVEEIVRTYRDLGYPVLLTSATLGIGIEELAAELRDRTTVVSGHSGVGKSSLLNALSPGLGRRVGDVNRHTSKGRHTTTRAELMPLPGGGFVVDTPGIRSFGIWDLTKADLGLFFGEFGPFLDLCHFHDCSHTHEPKCAVRDAVEAGTVSRARYAAYLRILETL